MKLTPELAGIYRTVQKQQSDGDDSDALSNLRTELEKIGDIIAKASLDQDFVNRGIVPEEVPFSTIVTGPKICPCCGRSLKE